MNNRNLYKFESDLKELMGADASLRPFVCDGSPFACEVFIVGFNPATELQVSFWNYWKRGVGFEKLRWFEDYKAERRSKTSPSGKTKRAEVSHTRRVIDWITKETDSVKCLETNLYSVPTAKKKDLSSSNRGTEVFKLLMEAVQPKIAILHGKDAGEYSEQLPDFCRGVVVPHFAIGWSQQNASQLGRLIRAATQTSNFENLDAFAAKLAAPKEPDFGYREEDLDEDFWKIIEEAKQLWEQKSEAFVATHPGGGAYHVIGAGIYVPLIRPGKRKPTSRRVISPPFSNDASIWSESGYAIVEFLKSKRIECRFDAGIDD